MLWESKMTDEVTVRWTRDDGRWVEAVNLDPVGVRWNTVRTDAGVWLAKADAPVSWPMAMALARSVMLGQPPPTEAVTR